MKESADRQRVFVSYSHLERYWFNELMVALKPRELELDLWSDTRINAGEHWPKEIDAALGRAHVAILLVSQKFLASDFIRHIEMPGIFDRHSKNGLTVIWILLEASDWKTTWLSTIRAVNEKPLRGMSVAARRRELQNIVEQIAPSDGVEHREAPPDEKSHRPVPDVHIRNIFAIKEENPLRDIRMAEIFAKERERTPGENPIQISLLARTGFSYLHPHGQNFKAGFAHLLGNDRHHIRVILEYPDSHQVKTRMRAASSMGAHMPQAQANVSLDWLNIVPKVGNLEIRLTVNPVYCSLFLTPDTVLYDPYHLGTLAETIAASLEGIGYSAGWRLDEGTLYLSGHITQQDYAFLLHDFGLPIVADVLRDRNVWGSIFEGPGRKS